MASLLHLITLLSVAAVSFSDGATCQAGWNEFNDHCYYVSTIKLSVDAAWIDCGKLGASVVTYHSKDEVDFVLNSMKRNKKATWTALNDMDTEGVFKWSDGSALDYEPWDKKEPNNFFKNEDCVELRTNGKFNDLRCWRKLHYVCEKSA